VAEPGTAGTLVIGYGNPLRGDDGLGWHAARMLQQHQDAHMHVLACQQLTPELAAPISTARLVVFIDASAAAETPAALRCLPIAPDEGAACSLTHHLTPGALLACTRLLYAACPPALLLSLPLLSSGYGEQLSPALAALLPALLARVRQVAAPPEPRL
jgi:hydrogenase maturation protease